MNYKYLVIVLCFAFVNTSQAKENNCNLSNSTKIPHQDSDVEKIIGDILQNQLDNVDATLLTEQLHHYAKNKININIGTKEELAQLFFLNPLHIHSIIKHRNENGPFISLLELQSVEGLDLELAHQLVHFVTVDSPTFLNVHTQKKLFDQWQHSILLRYGRSIGQQENWNTSNKNYLGCPNRFYTQYKTFSGDNLSASITMEKDSGEPFFADRNRNGFDFYSANIMLKNYGKIHKLIVGDYSLAFGEGLTLWSSFSLKKGASMISLAKPDVGIKPHTSVNENVFFRGVATTLQFGSLHWTPFISYKRLDANIKNGKITSLLNNGSHRTVSEMLDKNSATLFLYGSNIDYYLKSLKLGLTVYKSQYSHAIEPEEKLYKKFNFKGNELTNIGLNYHYEHRSHYFFGEFAHSIGSGYALLNGLISTLSPEVSLSLLHRTYQKNYHSFYSQAICEGSNEINENGLYTGLHIKPNAHWEYFWYIDFFSFPWLKKDANAPSKGYEIFNELTYKVSKQLKFTARYKFEEKQENNTKVEKKAIYYLEPTETQRASFEVYYKINDRFAFKNRVAFSKYQKEKEQTELGHLIYQDIIYSPLQSKISGQFRLAYFNIPSSNARIYAYENDVLHHATIHPYNYQGFRFYINGRYRITKGLDFWVKYSINKILTQDKSLLKKSKISPELGSEIKIQLRYQF